MYLAIPSASREFRAPGGTFSLQAACDGLGGSLSHLIVARKQGGHGALRPESRARQLWGPVNCFLGGSRGNSTVH